MSIDSVKNPTNEENPINVKNPANDPITFKTGL